MGKLKHGRQSPCDHYASPFPNFPSLSSLPLRSLRPCTFASPPLPPLPLPSRFRPFPAAKRPPNPTRGSWQWRNTHWTRLDNARGLRGLGAPSLTLNTFVYFNISSVRCQPSILLYSWLFCERCRVLSLSDRRYSLNPLSQTRIDWVGRYRIRLTFKLSCVWH